MHYYQFNIGDYASATAHLEPLEDLAYRRMLDLYYSSEQPIPEDLKQVARLIRMRTHCEFIATVLDEFFTLEDNGWHCDRVDVEIFKYTEKSHKASKSAKARWKKAKQKQKVKASCERIANAEETHSEGNAKHKPLTTNQEPITTNQEIPKQSSAKPPVDFSIFNMSAHHVDEVKRIRKQNKGGPISQRSANALAKEFLKAQALGLSTDDILTEWELRGWKAIKAEWLTNTQGVRHEKSQHRGPLLPTDDNSTIGRAGAIADRTSRDARAKADEIRRELAALRSQGANGGSLEAPSADQGRVIQQSIRHD